MANPDQQYAIKGNAASQQAEPSTVNRAAGTIQMRVLIELQVISFLLHQGLNATDDLAKLRQDIADSIT